MGRRIFLLVTVFCVVRCSRTELLFHMPTAARPPSSPPTSYFEPAIGFLLSRQLLHFVTLRRLPPSMAASTAAASCSSSSKGRIRYAAHDPTLPKPWRGLVDSSTGYLYFWNTETNVTQYERPLPLSPPEPQQLESFCRPAGQETDNRDRDKTQESNALSVVCCRNQASEPENSGNESRSKLVPGISGAGLSPEAYRQRHDIKVIGANVPIPYMSFDSTGFPSEILSEIRRAGFSAPTPIQAQSWPIALQNRDIVAIAKTGSGKTLGYLIPGFIHIKRLNNDARFGPTVLVLSPTRELATQIQDEAIKFGKSSLISCACLYGGAPKGPQLREIDRGVSVVIATPGRLNDILQMKRLSLGQVSYLVLDEADRMLDMGFEPQIWEIVNEIQPQRQTLMYTATWPKEVRKIAADLLVKPVQVNIGNVDELVANKAITQHIEVISPMQKRRRLEEILLSNGPSKYIVFCSTKRMCDQLAGFLDGPFGASAIHGDKPQMERDRVLNNFRSGKSPILVATDVAARGLDIKDIGFVINYDFPTGVEDYVHRIGRTGRAGATGIAYTFFCDQDAKYASDLIKILERADQKVPSELRDMVTRGGYGAKLSRWGSDSSYGHGNDDPSFRSYSQGHQDQYNTPVHRDDVITAQTSSSPSPNDDDGCYHRRRSRSRSPDKFLEAANGLEGH
ncbi:hypothetical protein HPP92_001168 [Vanilla planifolia]|uniref:RNA helicase n=1 Tax=Vanilla planifolia TaxID=51239 RepID=A0A835RZD7_VANPL|nr:hypothetical protein HPP92_001168 [Vanilla planifolia]